MPRKKGADGFDFTLHLWRLCADACTRLPELSHIDMERVAVSFAQARSHALHGLQAKLTPMRFEGGKLYTRRSGRTLTVQRLFDDDGREKIYILTFYLPRFLQHPLEEKLVTLFHELWHISPAFDGDLRRFPGRCYVHSHSEKAYDALAGQLAKKWISRKPPDSLYEFLKFDFDGLRQRYGSVYGLRIPIPKLIPVASTNTTTSK